MQALRCCREANENKDRQYGLNMLVYIWGTLNVSCTCQGHWSDHCNHGSSINQLRWQSPLMADNRNKNLTSGRNNQAVVQCFYPLVTSSPSLSGFFLVVSFNAKLCTDELPMLNKKYSGKLIGRLSLGKPTYSPSVTLQDYHESDS